MFIIKYRDIRKEIRFRGECQKCGTVMEACREDFDYEEDRTYYTANCMTCDNITYFKEKKDENN